MSFLVVHGSHLFSSGKLDFMWRLGPTGPLRSLNLIHKETLRELSIEQLIEEPVRLQIVSTLSVPCLFEGRERHAIGA
jgi:hypothetical protein